MADTKTDAKPPKLIRMAGLVFVAPAPGRAVPRPDGMPWPEDGDWLDEDQYVRRRLADGDLVAATPPPEGAPETAKVK